MLINEIVPAFTGIKEKLIPNAIPAYDCPLLFAYAPNAVVIGFIVSIIASIITLLAVSSLGIFQYTIIPVVITCFFECGTAAVVGNSVGGRRGAVISAAASGILMIFLMGFSLHFVDHTVALWMMGSGGQDFSVLAIIEGLILKLFPH
jgi:PTS system ascorbate-specific IIC component